MTSYDPGQILQNGITALTQNSGKSLPNLGPAALQLVEDNLRLGKTVGIISATPTGGQKITILVRQQASAQQATPLANASTQQEASQRIIAIMRNYEPISFTADRKLRDECMGSFDKPNSFFMYDGRRYDVRVAYVGDDGRQFFIKGVDQAGRELQYVTREFDAWWWVVRGKEEIYAQRALLANTNASTVGTFEKETYYVYKEEDIPKETLAKYPVTKTHIVTQDDVLDIVAEVQPDETLALNSYRIDSHKKFMVNGNNILTLELLNNIFVQIANNMSLTMTNAELHLSLAELEANLKPGAFSGDGFMAETDSLWGLIEQDSLTLQRLGVTHDQVAQRLDYLIQISKTTGTVVELDGGKTRLKVDFIGTRGVQFCPWGQLDAYHTYRTGSPATMRYDSAEENWGYIGETYPTRGSKDYVITNLSTGEHISFGDMAPHLIGDHHFFEGDVPYRMDPEIFVRVLGLQNTTIVATPITVESFAPLVKSQRISNNMVNNAATAFVIAKRNVGASFPRLASTVNKATLFITGSAARGEAVSGTDIDYAIAFIDGGKLITGGDTHEALEKLDAEFCALVDESGCVTDNVGVNALSARAQNPLWPTQFVPEDMTTYTSALNLIPLSSVSANQAIIASLQKDIITNTNLSQHLQEQLQQRLLEQYFFEWTVKNNKRELDLLLFDLKARYGATQNETVPLLQELVEKKALTHVQGEKIAEQMSLMVELRQRVGELRATMTTEEVTQFKQQYGTDLFDDGYVRGFAPELAYSMGISLDEFTTYYTSIVTENRSLIREVLRWP